MKALICIVALAACVLGGCVSSSEQFKGVTLKQVSENALLITAVPPLLQDKAVSCGPTCVSAVAVYWDINPSRIATNNLYSYYHEDFTVEDLERLAVGFGLTAFKYQGTLEDLETNLKKGRPVIVMIPKPHVSTPLQLNLSNVPISEAMANANPSASHWIIVIGMLGGKLIVQDPATGRRFIPKGEFDREWSKRARTSLLLTKD
jgi:ABC-type bacteriocin/lantibiotic exporter with double-glycine peptidase domain